MTRSSILMGLGLPLAFIACGGGGGGGQSSGIRTLAYVVTECHEDARTLSGSQRLVVMRGDEAPVIVAELPSVGGFPAIGLCPLYGALRNGINAVFALPFQRIGLSPDGAGIVFEVNFEFSLWITLGVRNPYTERQGIFYVRADGTGLRRLGDPSHEPAQRLGGIPSASMRFVAAYFNTFFAFSPDGKTVAFTDRGPGPAREDAAQVVIMDIATGERTPVTRLPPVTTVDPSNPVSPAILYVFWADDDLIAFRSRANPNNLNPEGAFRTFFVRKDGTDLRIATDFVPAALPDSRVVPIFRITQALINSDVGTLSMPGVPKNPFPDYVPPNPPIQEIFLFAGDQALQLTKFDRVETTAPVLDSDGQRVFFLASVDRFGTNPSENCQIFSVSTAGGDLRQLTRFSASEHSSIGCLSQWVGQMGCLIIGGPAFDPETQTLIFDSTCDPLGTNPAGHQIFSMRTDGTDLRQLTGLRGVVDGANGSVDVELPGPIEIRF